MKQFNSFGAFAAHLAQVQIALHHAEVRALEECAEIVEKAAKEKIGEYHPAAGTFAAWAPLAESTLKEKERLGYAPPDNPLLRTGEMRDSIEHKVAYPEAQIGSDSDIAVYQELGTDRIPPRSFLGSAAVENEKRIVSILGNAVQIALTGNLSLGHTQFLKKIR